MALRHNCKIHQQFQRISREGVPRDTVRPRQTARDVGGVNTLFDTNHGGPNRHIPASIRLDPLVFRTGGTLCFNEAHDVPLIHDQDA